MRKLVKDIELYEDWGINVRQTVEENWGDPD
jgi:hypothetical protein